jgi:amino acid transporter
VDASDGTNLMDEIVQESDRDPVAAELNHDSLSFLDAMVIGLNATSPAYSLAAVIGPIVALVGVAAPGVLLASFVPMLLIASAFYYMDRADQDCGTTFSWVTRAMGPWFGWQGGWAIAMTGILVVGALADVAVRFTLLMIGLDDVAYPTEGTDGYWLSRIVVIAATLALVLLMTWICVVGTEMSARVQNTLIILQVAALLVFAGVALYQVAAGDRPDSLTPQLSWLNPFAEGGGALTGGLLLGVFAYWGWESAVNLTEETSTSEGRATAGLAGVLSTVVLVVSYLSVAFAIVAVAGTDFLTENAGEEEAIFALIGEEVLGGWDWILLLAVVTSAVASTQTTIIPASRTALSMARRQALPRRFGHIHPRFRTPDVSTWWVAAIAGTWYVVVSLLSENALFDSLTALSLVIAFYYSLTGIACALYYRKHLLSSPVNLLLIGIGPVVGALLLLWLLVEAAADMADPANSYSGQAWLGVGPPLVIGGVIFAAGLVLMFVWRARDRRFWDEKAGVVDATLVAKERGR